MMTDEDDDGHLTCVSVSPLSPCPSVSVFPLLRVSTAVSEALNFTRSCCHVFTPSP